MLEQRQIQLEESKVWFSSTPGNKTTKPLIFDFVCDVLHAIFSFSHPFSYILSHIRLIRHEKETLTWDTPERSRNMYKINSIFIY